MAERYTKEEQRQMMIVCSCLGDAHDEILDCTNDKVLTVSMVDGSLIALALFLEYFAEKKVSRHETIDALQKRLEEIKENPHHPLFTAEVSRDKNTPKLQ